MAQAVNTLVYTLSELDEDARERARDWYREQFDDDWCEPVITDFCTVCSIVGVQLKTVRRALYGGGSRDLPCIWFRGFWSQGDGACFEGSWCFQRQAPQRIREYAPQDRELHGIADRLLAVSRRNFYQLRARIVHRGPCLHRFAMGISVDRDSPVDQDATTDAEDVVAEAMRDLAHWLYVQLEREYEYQASDAVVDEMCAANGWTFTADGRRFG